MVPYIAALILLIVAVLFTVTRQVDCFTSAANGADKKSPRLYEVICGGTVKKSGEDTKQEKEKPVTKDEAKVTPTEEQAPEMSASFTKELEDRLSKSIATQIKDTMLAERATQKILQDPSCPYAPYSSDATAQGSEYIQGKPHPGPDMSEYIRKDSIPCWNCSLP